jgi:DNA mismatch repair protein MutL
MGKINILDKSVAEKIAAGEVVEKPASVVKELVENSFDAGASSVTVEIERGGIEYIRVTDNGSGIMRDDVSAAFLRHATSKIKDEYDLERISSLGFRGEALCSISAVSKTELLTKTKDEECGVYMAVVGGETTECTDAGCPTGTTITVRNLFFNTPARMKFLKRDSQEASYVTDICQRAALSHPEVSFRYIREGKDVFFTPGDNVLKNAVRAIFGKDVSNAMTEVDRIEGCIRVSGLTGTNNLSRPNRNMQFFYVNGRLVKSNLLSLAMNEAYKNELMGGRFPVCVIEISMPPELVDVNVHPAKTEVKFSNDEEVYRAVAIAVRSALTREASPREVLLKNEKAFKTAVESVVVKQEKLDFKSRKPMFKPVSTIGETPVKEEKKPKFSPVERNERVVSSPSELPVKKIEKLEVKEDYAPEDMKVETEQKKEEVKPEIKIPEFEVVGQLFATYIIVQTEKEMIMIDQHAAHERLNYEKIKDEGAMHQTLLMPITCNLTPREKVVWEDNRDFLQSMGFDTEEFGSDSVIIRSLPSDIDFADGEGLLIEVLTEMSGEGRGEISEKRDRAIYTVACKAAIKANNNLSLQEMKSLAERALSMEGISTCPHGRPISVKMTKYQVEKMFKRIV